MKNDHCIFSRHGLEKLRSHFSPNDTLVVFDFDGTLAPIVPQHQMAKIERGVRIELEKLSEAAHLLLLTGRSIADVRNRVPSQLQHIIGSHGLEGTKSINPDQLNEASLAAAYWAETLGVRLANDKRYIIENKVYSIAVHYRGARREKKAAKRALKEIRRLGNNAKVICGKKVFNIVPAGLPNKYAALCEYMENLKLKNAIFVGDDITDNAVFRAYDPKIMSIKVGTSKELAAQWFIRDQSEILKLLETLNELIPPASKHMKL